MIPATIMDGINGNETSKELNSPLMKENMSATRSPRTPPSPKTPPIEPHDPPVDGRADASIEQLYDNVREMQSSASDGEESRIDTELCDLVRGEMKAMGVTDVKDDAAHNAVAETKSQKSAKMTQSPRIKSSVSSKKARRPSRQQLQSDASTILSQKSTGSPGKSDNGAKMPGTGTSHAKKQGSVVPGEVKLTSGAEDPSEPGLDNPDLGPFLLKHARDLVSSGDNPRKALKYALRAAKSFEKCADEKPNLDLVMSLHVIAAIHCKLGQYSEAIPVLEQSIEIPDLEEGHEHALAKFSGYMQLGDTHAMLGQLESSIRCYTGGLEVQMKALGDKDPRVGETCRYLAEAHAQAMQFDEAERLCRMALDIHRQTSGTASLEEIADRRLMGLICDMKGDHEAALEHLVLASMAMVANGQEAEVASVDCSIGDVYLSLARYDEAAFAYQKSLTVFKTTKGENHPAVASIFVRLADLYNKTGKFRESKSYCENALRIYGKPLPGALSEETACGLTDISAIYQSMDEPEQALELLEKALKIYNDAPGQQSTIAGIEAQMGVLYYMTGKFNESYVAFKNAISKLCSSGEKKSAFFGIALNQMGLTCIQRYDINEAAELFEEARSILEQEYGPYHQDTLGVYSNLAGTYDAMGRSDEAIAVLEYLVGIREEKLGTANPDVDDEKRRLAELLKEAGRARNRRPRSLENLLDTNSHSHAVKKDANIAA